MNIIKTKEHLRQALNPNGKNIGLVPTMGYLHEGHLSLIKRAREECDTVVVSIFVNPLQFGPQEDLATYPRDLDRDMRLAAQAGADHLFAPSVEVMYPQPPLTTVSVSEVTEGMCGAKRPGHFDGVTTVVAKLFHLIKPRRAYFGMKDIQQVAVIQQMVTDLNMPVTIIPCATVREKDGLALSSRNVNLTAEERRQATILFRALQRARQKISNGEWRTGRLVEREVHDMIASQPLAQIDYVEMRTFPQLERVTAVDDGAHVVAVAVKFGQVRLIDNILIPERSANGDVSYDDER